MADPEEKPLRPARRRLPRVLAGLALAVAALLSALWFARAALVERVLAAALESRLGLEVGLAVEHAGLEGLVLTDVRLGSDSALEIARVTLGYDIQEALAGHVRTVDLEGIAVNASIGPDGLSVGSLDPVLAGTGGGGALPPLPAIRFANAAINLSTAFGLVTARADGALETLSDGRLELESTLGLRAEQGRLDGSVSMVYGRDGAIDGAVAVGPGDLAAAEDMRLRGFTGRITFARPDGGTALQADAALSAEAVDLPGLALGQAAATLDFDGERLRADGSVGTADGRADGTMRAQLAPFAEPMTLDAESTLSLRAGADLWSLLPLPADARATGPAQATLSFSVTGTADAFAGDMRLTSTASGLDLPAASAGPLVLSLPATVTFAENTLTVTPLAGGVLRVDKADIRLGETARLTSADALTIPVEPADGAHLAVGRGTAGLQLRYDLTLSPAPVAATLAAAGEVQTVTGQTPRLRLDGGPADGVHAARITGSAGALALSGWKVQLDGMAGTARLGPLPSGETTAATLSIARASHGAAFPFVVPLGLEARLERAAEAARFSGTLADASGRLRASFSGRHDPATGAGEVSIALDRLAFGVGIAGPETLFPILRRFVRNVAGEFGLRAGLAWDTGGLDGSGEVLLEGASAEFGTIAVKQLNTVLAFDTRTGKRRSKRQEIAIGALDVGVPLTDGRVALRIEPSGRLLVEEMRWTLAGGRVFAEDFAIDPRADRHRIVLEVKDVDFAELLAVYQLEGVGATGALSGRIPVEIIGEDTRIEKGELAAAAAGALRYKPAQYPAALERGGEGMKLALRALEDFRYDSLRMTLNRQLGGETLVTLHLEGRNPNLYDGYPIALNLTLSGALDRMLQQGLEGYRVPEKIRQRLLDFAR